MLIKCFSFYLSLLILIKGSEEKFWSSQLANYIKNKIDVHQVILLIEDEESYFYPSISDTIQKISRVSSTKEISSQQTTIRNAQDLISMSFFSPQTTLFLIIYKPNENSNNSQLTKVINFILELSQAQARPKCLFLNFGLSESSTGEELLRYMWSKLILDATIISFKNVETKNNYFQTLQQEVDFIHFFNPFSDTYVRKKYSHRIPLFPNKLLNLQEYKMKIGLVNNPPHCVIEKSEAHITKLSGPDILKLNIFSRLTNFSIVKILGDWGVINCDKDKNTGFIYDLIYNQIRFVAVESGRYASCDEKFYLWSKGTSFRYLYLVVPVLKNTSSVDTDEWKILNLFVFLGLILLLWLLSHILIFSSENWRLIYIVQIVLGSSMPRCPKKLAERIILGSLLLTCTLNSSSIYSTFADLTFKVNTEMEFKTIESVICSNLQPIMELNIFKMLGQQYEGSVKSLLKKAKPLNITNEECVDLLIKEKNVACVVEGDAARLMFRDKVDKYGKPLIKIVEENVKVTVTGIAMETGSPFIRRFDEITQRLIDSGIIDRWREDHFDRKSIKVYTNGSDESMKPISVEMWNQFFIILVFGYICSLITLIAEIISKFVLSN